MKTLLAMFVMIGAFIIVPEIFIYLMGFISKIIIIRGFDPEAPVGIIQSLVQGVIAFMAGTFSSYYLVDMVFAQVNQRFLSIVFTIFLTIYILAMSTILSKSTIEFLLTTIVILPSIYYSYTKITEAGLKKINE